MKAERKRKILVVDDDRDSRNLYRALLTPFGHDVLEASDGKEGLEQADRHRPDLIISDILMPTMNGYEFVSLLRKSPEMENVPVIFHSASFLDNETRSLGAACGVSLFILKPCEPEQALAVIREALGFEPQKPAPSSAPSGLEAIPLLLDAFFEKGKKLDAVSVRLAHLLELGMQLVRSDTIDNLIERAGDSTRKIIGADYSGVGILRENGQELRKFALVGTDFDTAAKLSGAQFRGQVFWDMTNQVRTCLFPSAVGKAAELELPLDHPPVRNFLGTPLIIGGRVYGWIYVANKLGSLEFSQEDAHTLRAVAAYTAMACENMERFHTIEERTNTLEIEIAERTRAENRFRMLVETAPTGIVIADQRGHISDLNAQTLRMFGYEREELVGQSVEILLPGRVRKIHEQHRSSYTKDPHARPMGLGMDLFARRKDGTEFPVEISLGPLTTKEGMLVSAAIVDITARKKMEEQMRLSQRLEAIGKLAGGVAHDFNNLLAVIMGSCDIVTGLLPPEHPASPKISLVKQASSSAADLTRQLLAFSRQQMLQPRVVELREVIGKVELLLGRLIGENIELRVSIAPSTGSIKVDPGQIEQVLLNLAVNSRDAMERGGVLTISAENVELDETYKQEHQPVIPGPYVLLSVHDTGCGMDQKTQACIFDPFFTTKELGKGTGLGLATVYGIVKQSGGYIWVYSEVGRGTIFKLYFPRVGQAAVQIENKPPEKEFLQGNETILLAEDSESLREIATEYLQSLGYTVICAASGLQALQRAREFKGTIHVLLTDVVMPEMSGPELATKLSSIYPPIKVIFTSGYTSDVVARQGILDPSVAFIQKPYRPKALAHKIREVLRANAMSTEVVSQSLAE